MPVRNFSSTAVSTTLAAGISAANTTIQVAATTGFPAAPFILAVGAGSAAQELVLVTGVAGTTLTVTRGYDSTVASTHEVGAVVQHSHGAIDLREANSHVNASSGVHGRTGDVVGTTDTQTLTNKTVALGNNTVSGTKAQFNAALTDADFKTTTDPDFSEWLAYTPTFNYTIGTGGTLTGRYIQIGKLVHFWARAVLGTGFTIGAGPALSIPVARRSGGPDLSFTSLITDAGSGNHLAAGFLGSAGTSASTWITGTNGVFAAVSPTFPFAWAAGDEIAVHGTYEAA